MATPVVVEEEDGNEELVSTIPFAALFQRYAPITGWDWHWLAAIAWEESHFNPAAISPVGALGLMQLMPATAERFGLNDSTVLCAEDNIRAGAQYICRLQQTYAFITDSVQNRLFVLASYNAGPAHIMDARRLAKRYGRSPYVWHDNTEYWLNRLAEPEVAADSVVLYGSFNPEETTRYVRNVVRTCHRLRKEHALHTDL